MAVNVRREEELWGVSERNHVRVSVCLSFMSFPPLFSFFSDPAGSGGGGRGGGEGTREREGEGWSYFRC